MIAEAKAFWDAIAGKVKSLIRTETENAMRMQRYDVTTAPNGTVMGVTQPFGSTEIFLPYSKEVAGATVGDTVLVAWWGSMSNARVYYYAKGYDGGGGASPYSGTPAALGTASPGTSNDFARGDHVHAMPSASDVGALPDTYPTSWTLAGTTSSSSATVTYPTTATELYVVANSNHTNAPQYTALFLVSMIENRTVLMVGGYYYSTSDYGIVNLTHNTANHTLAFRNLRFTSNTSGTFSIYYR